MVPMKFHEKNISEKFWKTHNIITPIKLLTNPPLFIRKWFRNIEITSNSTSILQIYNSFSGCHMHLKHDAYLSVCMYVHMWVKLCLNFYRTCALICNCSCDLPNTLKRSYGNIWKLFLQYLLLLIMFVCNTHKPMHTRNHIIKPN